jgi:molybdenum cofactor synthesis domain-containing protein
MTKIEVVSVNVSQQRGTIKRPAGQIAVNNLGVVGDAHSGPGLRQVSLLAQESVERFAAGLGEPVGPGEFGENITFRGIPAEQVVPLDRFRLGEVELEITQIGKECHGPGCTIFQRVGQCVMPAEGLFARVLRGGVLRPGDSGEHCPRPLTCLVVTLSDRAAAGQYADRSGPRIQELLEAFFAAGLRQLKISRRLLSDDPEQLRLEILAAVVRGVDVVFTCGGTGVGPRDKAPETVAALCDTLIPGIMEHVRAKFGSQNPRARLSRSLAGVAAKTQIYTLPGSVRAVEEYTPEILQTLEHLLYMLHGLDVH